MRTEQSFCIFTIFKPKPKEKTSGSLLIVLRRWFLRCCCCFFFFLFFFCCCCFDGLMAAARCGTFFVVCPGPEVIKRFSCSTQLGVKFVLLMNMKMPTIVDIFIIISREIFMLSYV